MEKKVLATKVVHHLIEKDFFCTWLRIEILEISEGYSKNKMIVRKKMENGFGIV